MQIYLTKKEREMALKYIQNSVSILGEAEDTWEDVEKDMENGLGSLLTKLYKGMKGEEAYKKYKK